jgi:DNA-binding HxlR family transcriptional regulator
MYKYGQYCPIAKALEILGDRWTLLIVRDMLTGTRHFNDLERGLPGISRGLLAERLRRLQQMGVVNKIDRGNDRRRTEYQLSQAGEELQAVIGSLLTWGAHWAFNDPEPNELDPVLLLWWMRDRVRVDQLPQQRVVVQFDFKGAVNESFWLVLTKEDVSVCLTSPGFELNVLITADLATYFKIWLGKIRFSDALDEGLVEIDAIPSLADTFPDWFAYSYVAATVYATIAESPIQKQVGSSVNFSPDAQN